ncbi:hypothetical protein BS17DRAFT_808352 [Gyrodon lividus]|nr:hypothetical protein BS17DRAFT_808352 [Gyrodon lividus]
MSESTYAASPFDHAKADIILRSSDNTDFRVFKLFLSLASPFSKPSLISLSLPKDPNLEELKDVVDVLEAAKKYSLDAIERKVAQAISNPKILEVEPVRCYVIAHRSGLREETLLAARYTLRWPLIPEWFEEIELLTATDLLTLLTYHQQCAIAAQGLVDNPSWITAHYGLALTFPFTSETCSSCLHNQTQSGKYWIDFPGCYILRWWTDFCDNTFILLRDKPCRATIEMAAEEVIRTVRQRNCKYCSPRVTEIMREFTTLFADKLEEAVSQGSEDFGQVLLVAGLVKFGNADLLQDEFFNIGHRNVMMLSQAEFLGATKATNIKDLSITDVAHPRSSYLRLFSGNL